MNESADRDRAGRFVVGNRAALVAGQFSTQFWASVDAARTEFRRLVLTDLGHADDRAPHALTSAADGLAQATMLRDSAFLRIAESGGPTTLRGRRRAAFRVWCEASDRAERYLRLVGLNRVPRPIDPLEAVRQAVAAANRKQEEQP